MAIEPKKSAETPPLSADRLWAEQLAIGMALFMGLLIFMALVHPAILSAGVAGFGHNYLSVYGWASAIGILLQVVVHEMGTLLAALWLGLPIRFRLFGFGANATAILESQPRRVWIDARLGFAGPITGSLVSIVLWIIFLIKNNADNPQISGPFFLGMACVGCFYNLFTLIPVLDLEGGWIAPSIAPQGWLFGLAACVLVLTQEFNLILLGLVSFGVPRLILLITARLPQTDQVCSSRQRLIANLGYFGLVLLLAWFGSWAFGYLPTLVPNTMGD